MDEQICFNNLNCINNNKQHNINPFTKALENIKENLNNIINNKEKYNDSNAIKEVFYKHLYISSFFKSKKIDNINNSIFNQKYSGDTIHYSNSKNINNTKDNSLTNININYNKERINNQNNNNRNNNPINSNFVTQKNDNLYKKSNESTKVYISPNINVQNYIINHNNLNGISGNINSYNNLNDNQILLNINSNINVKNNNINLIGKKRNLDDKKNEENNNIYNEIKDLFNKYKKNIKDENIQNDNKIFENNVGFFEQNDTVIINKKPVCVIYLNKNHIYKIYLINERNTIEDDTDIIDVKLKLIT